MPVKNYYPELPEIPYKKTSIPMQLVIDFGKQMLMKYQRPHVVMALAIFRFESANGKKGVNNNYGGIQADVGRWSNMPQQPIATSVKVDSGGKERRFLCFDESNGYKVCFELFCIKAMERNMKTPQDYYAKWVSNPNPTQAGIDNFQTMLNSCDKQLS